MFHISITKSHGAFCVLFLDPGIWGMEFLPADLFPGKNTSDLFRAKVNRHFLRNHVRASTKSTLTIRCDFGPILACLKKLHFKFRTGRFVVRATIQFSKIISTLHINCPLIWLCLRGVEKTIRNIGYFCTSCYPVLYNKTVRRSTWQTRVTVVYWHLRYLGY